MQKLLILGVSGLLGINLALEAEGRYALSGVSRSQALSGAGFPVRLIDLEQPGALRQVLDELQPDAVINRAALASLEACEKDPQRAQRLNAELPAELAAETAERIIPLLHISTDAVFDGQKGNYAEDDAPNPLSIYAKTKLAGEEAVQKANPGALIVRTVFYGWSLSGKRSLSEFFYNRLSAKEPTPGHTDRRFSPLLVNDLATLLLIMLERSLQGCYHVAGAESLSKYEFGIALAREFNLDADLIQPTASSAADLLARRAPDLSLNVDKLTATLGRELPDVRAGLRRLYELHQAGYPARLRALLTETAVPSS